MAPTAFPPATSAPQIYLSIRLALALTRFFWGEKPLWSSKVEYWGNIQQIKSRQKVLPIERDSLWEGGDSLLSLKMSYTVYCIFVSLGKAKWLCFK